MRPLFLFILLVLSFSATNNLYAQKNKFSNLTEKKGKIGIGTKNPDALLTVKGEIHAQEVRVDLKGAIAPDYVFEEYFRGKSTLQPQYQRWNLNELETYIEKHLHLPGIPSAETFEKEGMNLAELNLLLLEKVEELTLHLIDQQKEIQNLKEDLKQLQR